MDSFTQDNSQDPVSFAEQVMDFLATVTSQAKRSHGEADALTLLAIDALISNMYSYGRAG